MINGLNPAEIQTRIEEGKVNHSTTQKISTWSIIKKNVFTLFNVLNVVLAAIVILAGSPKNALFSVIAVVNSAIAIFNELRAKKIVENLNLISAQKVTVIRDGKKEKIDNEEIVLDDVLALSLGDQIVVDSVLLEGELEVNESFLTGESKNIAKHPGDQLLSGSFIIAGSGFSRVTAVGNDNFTSKILHDAKKINTRPSHLFKILNKIVRYISYALIPIGAILFIKQYFIVGSGFSTSTLSTVAVLLSMIPEGLILLTSSVLALSTIRLSKEKVLVQDLYSIETIARADVICLDKTGTLTTGEMKVEKVIPLGGHTDHEIEEVVTSIVSNLEDKNSTYNALKKYYPKKSSLVADEIFPFSSDRKYSGIRIKNTKYLMGAREFITDDKTYSFEEKELSEKYRVLTVAKTTAKRTEILGFILISDQIRKNAADLINFFHENDVEVKIISGDNIGTIKQVCASVGMTSIKAIDLSKIDEINYKNIVKEYNIFARVLPEQKKKLVRALKQNGHVVAMTGDGVNDTLALKESDCGISLGSGADAARRASELVLLGDDFSVVPSIIYEGRQTVNNIERSASLFIHKTIFASVLSIIFIFIPSIYPFAPIEMGLINVIIIGIPSFILALEPNHKRIKNNFVKNIKDSSVPAALTTICTVLLLVLAQQIYDIPNAHLYTFSYINLTIVGLLLIAKISIPFNKVRIWLLSGLCLISALAYIIPFTRSFFMLQLLSETETEIAIALAGITIVLFFIFSKMIKTLKIDFTN